MKVLFLILLLPASLQLQCDKAAINAYVGGNFILICKYDTSRFRYSKKYWCRGQSRDTCAIVADVEHGDKSSCRSCVIDLGRTGLFVKVSDLQLKDSGWYWVGIDKIYADVMTSINVVVTEVPVSKPTLWPLRSLMDRPTCWGQPVTLRCGCTKGTAVQYAWFRRTHPEDLLLQPSSDFLINCSTVGEESRYYCVARNDISIQWSETVYVQVLRQADESCVYVVNMHGQPVYDCADRLSTAAITTTAAPLTTCPLTTVKLHTDPENQSLQFNQNHDHEPLSHRPETLVPVWYTFLRWGSLASLVMFLCIILKCTKNERRRERSFCIK